MIKDIIQSFLPWILFFVLLGRTPHQLEVAIIASAIVSIVFEFNALKKGFILSWGTLLFFIFLFVAVIIFNNHWIGAHFWLFSNGALALIAWVSIILGKPFTIQYAKEKISKEKWNHPLFLKINYLLSGFWGIIFLIGVGLHLLKIYYPALNGWFFEVFTYIPSIIGIWVTTWFPNWYKRKYQP